LDGGPQALLLNTEMSWDSFVPDARNMLHQPEARIPTRAAATMARAANRERSTPERILCAAPLPRSPP
jgi:hypothetical protein